MYGELACSNDLFRIGVPELGQIDGAVEEAGIKSNHVIRFLQNFVDPVLQILNGFTFQRNGDKRVIR